MTAERLYKNLCQGVSYYLNMNAKEDVVLSNKAKELAEELKIDGISIKDKIEAKFPKAKIIWGS